MILDLHAQPALAGLFRLLDAATGECLDGEFVTYADDVAGRYRRLLSRSGDPRRPVFYLRHKVTGAPASECPGVARDQLEVADEWVDRPIRLVFLPEGAATPAPPEAP